MLTWIKNDTEASVLRKVRMEETGRDRSSIEVVSDKRRYYC
jgi:hypothetical protein